VVRFLSECGFRFMTDGLHATDQWSGDVAAVRSEFRMGLRPTHRHEN